MGRPAPVRSRQHTTAHRAQDPDPFLLLGPRTDHPSGLARAGALCARVITLRFARPGLSGPGGPPSPLSPLSSSTCLSVLLTPSRAPLLYLSPNPPRVACLTVFHPLSQAQARAGANVSAQARVSLAPACTSTASLKMRPHFYNFGLNKSPG